MDLIEVFVLFVVLVGYVSYFYNNLYYVLFECGVCGGVLSGFNVKLLVMICNCLNVR